MAALEAILEAIEQFIGQLLPIPLDNALSLLYTILNGILLLFAGIFGG